MADCRNKLAKFRYGVTAESILLLCDQSGGAGVCWPFKGLLDRYGYPKPPMYKRKYVYLARTLFGLLHPDTDLTGLVMRHTCDNPSCLNPSHLTIGTQKDNMRDRHERGRSWQTKKTHCPHGHPYSPENTQVKIHRGFPTRQCMECKKRYKKIYKNKTL